MYINIDGDEYDLLVELLSQQHNNPGLASVLQQLQHKETDEEQAYRNKATELHHVEGYIEVDGSVVSVGDDGAYVLAWVFVCQEDVYHV